MKETTQVGFCDIRRVQPEGKAGICLKDRYIKHRMLQMSPLALDKINNLKFQALH